MRAAGLMLPVFLDSNVILYLASGDTRRADIAEHLLHRGGVISVQVMNEIARVTRGKWAMDWEKTQLLLDRCQALLTVVPVDLAVHSQGMLIAQRYKIAIFDSMIAAAALEAGCDTLYSEDMHAGLVIDGRLRIVNPFAPAD